MHSPVSSVRALQNECQSTIWVDEVYYHYHACYVACNACLLPKECKQRSHANKHKTPPKIWQTLHGTWVNKRFTSTTNNRSEEVWPTINYTTNNTQLLLTMGMCSKVRVQPPPQKLLCIKNNLLQPPQVCIYR